MTRPNHDPRRILLIDQNPAKQTLRATILRNFEIEVHTAASITEAGNLWTARFYDLVLLGAQENLEEAIAASATIKKMNPRQRIGLLVGPPAFVRELGGGRRKAASIAKPSFDPTQEDLTPPVSDPSPQWQETIRRLVTDWYVDHNVLPELSKSATRIAGA